MRKPEQPAQQLEWLEVFCAKQLAEKHNHETRRRRPKRTQETASLDLAQACGFYYLAGNLFMGLT